jgi:hypothetical protein
MQGALEIALGGVGEQGHRIAILRHPVELEHIVLEVDVLEEETRSSRLVRLFGERTRGQSAQRIHP